MSENQNETPKEQEERKENPFSAYAVTSQIIFIIALPLLLFVVGGVWLVDKLSLPEWLKIVSVLLGIVMTLGSLASYLWKLSVKYSKTDKKQVNKLLNQRKDNDYYDDNIKKKHF